MIIKLLTKILIVISLLFFVGDIQANDFGPCDAQSASTSSQITSDADDMEEKQTDRFIDNYNSDIELVSPPNNDETIQWTGNAASYTIEVHECNPNLNNMGSFNLKDYNLSVGPITTQIANDLSALTYNSSTNSLFAAVNGTPTIYELNLNGTVIRTINLSGFDDTEGLVWIGGNDYIVIEERRRRAVKITIGTATVSISYPSNHMQLPGATGDNLGLEGVGYNPATNELIIVKEKSPLTLYSFVVPANYSSPISVNYPFNIATNNFNLSDLSGLHHLGLNNALCEMNVDDHFLVLSQESKLLIETDASGFEYSRLNLDSGGANGTPASALAQAEGVTVDNQGNIYIVSEPNIFYKFTNPNINLTPQNNSTLVYSTNISNRTNSLTIPGSVLAPNTTYCWSVQDDKSNACPQSGVFTTGKDTCDGTLAGTSCNDNDACTTNDVYDANCNCAGAFADADADGVCDTNDICPNGNDNIDTDNDGTPDDCDTCNGTLAGTTCNDNNACTTSDVYDANCNCAGTFADTDADGVCDANDICAAGDDNIDTNNNGTPDACDSNCPATQSFSINSRISSGNDDVEEKQTGGTVYNSSSDLELVYDTYLSAGNQYLGMLFRNLNIPQGATITNAYVQFTVDEVDTGATSLSIAAQDADNAASFSTNSYNVSNRTLTSANVAWLPPAWTSVGAAGAAQQTPDISSVVQELVNRSGWTRSSNLAIIIKGTGSRTAESYNGSPSQAPIIYVDYTVTSTGSGDADGDGVCDVNDICPNGDDNIDTDNDGTPDACDTCDGNLAGTVCNDGDPCTVGDVYDANCNCVVGTYTDADNDGICAAQDPDDTDPCIPTASPNCNTGGGNCTTFNKENFDTNWGIWNDGGVDSYRYSGYANSSTRSIRIRDNSGSNSSMYTNPLDLSAYTSLGISFSYYPVSMENGEDFFLEISTNGGSTFTLYQEWNSGVEFQNNNRYNEALNITGITFTANTVIRFRCDASSNFDQIYIDDVLIEGCTGNQAANLVNRNNTIITEAEQIQTDPLLALKVYPNPANRYIKMDLSGIVNDNTNEQVTVIIYSLEGKLVYSEEMTAAQIIEVDIRDLLSNSPYFVRVQVDDKMLTNKFVKLSRD